MTDITEQKQLLGEIADPCVMVIFGAAGDLTKRKLIPALYNLAKGNLLSREFAVIGVARDAFTTESWRAEISAHAKDYATDVLDPDLWDWFQHRLYYVQGEFGDAVTFQKLREQLEAANQSHNTHSNYLYYLATPPMFFSTIVKQLGDAGLVKEEEHHWRRVIIEKPFGRDLESAQALNADICTTLTEPQIYRIDHYLGKETVQNILAFRFSNGIFEPIWNRNYIDHVQITVAESLGVEQRGGYYETAGAMRDMIPNHTMQLIALTCMEPPISFDADDVRDEMAKVIHAINPFDPEEVLTHAVRGQYDAGQLGEQKAIAYRSEEKVSPNSATETFVALKLELDNWRWADVPIYVRTGKRLPRRLTEIAIQFKHAPYQLFRKTNVEKLRTNRLVIHIQPDEGISLRFGAKIPGPIVNLGAVKMSFNYKDYFGSTPSTGYERLIYDCMNGDQTLFQRADMVEAGWAVVDPILDVWQALPPRTFPNYASGTWGPKEAAELLARDGRQWREIHE
ncbi:MAG: glucose-6-phosphate dehydrogenase [Blastocatellia bacterium]|nr:glucose-6-phosphate dehydrogenase [Blastocatellia bacterium]